MSNNTNYFAMEEELNEFEMWQGLRGPYYTPSVSPDGELSWTNNGSLPNPAPVDLTGPAGKSAYEAAREGGYQGTEAEFNEALAEIDTALQPSDVDSQLSGTSENPVQNKVITQELADQKSANDDKFRAILDCLKNVIYATGDGSSYYNRLALLVNDGYVFYDYIEMIVQNVNVQGIIADVPMTKDYIYSIKFCYGPSSSGSFLPILGNRVNKQLGLYVKPSTGQVGYWWGGTDTPLTIYGLTPNTKHTVVFKPVGESETYPTYATITIDGTEYSTGATDSGITWLSYLGLFAPATSTTETYEAGNFGQKIEEFTITDRAGNLIASLKPAFNGTYYGFYDSVSQKFWYKDADHYNGGNWQ